LSAEKQSRLIGAGRHGALRLARDFAGFTDNIHRDFDKVLVGINWRFGGASAPVAARY
jgi:hypothetical protein